MVQVALDDPATLSGSQGEPDFTVVGEGSVQVEIHWLDMIIGD